MFVHFPSLQTNNIITTYHKRHAMIRMESFSSCAGLFPCQANKFDIPKKVAYLNAAFMSPQLRASTAALEKGARRKASPWNVAKEDFYADRQRLRELYASLIGARSQDVAIIPSSSYGAAAAALNILPTINERQNVVTLGGEHISNRFVWQRGSERNGYRLRVAKPPCSIEEGRSWTDEVLDQIDDNTGAVAVTPCFWTDGTKLNLERISQRCQDIGAAFVVDATQSVHVDVRGLEPDFLISSGYKWLLCPYGVSFLYVAPKWYQGDSETVEIHGWDDPESGRGKAMWGIPGGESADGLLDMTSSRTALRFDMGESGNFSVLPAAVAALEQLNEWQPSRISSYLSPLTARAEDSARSRGWNCPSSRVDHMIGLRREEGWPGDLVERCSQNHNVHISIRGESMRISPHVYNTHEDIDKMFAALDDEL